MPTAAAHSSPRVTRFEWVALGVLLLLALLLRADHLGHADIKDLDEVFHAIVARSLIEHPLTPTLYETPYLPYDAANWQANHVWLHKPPVALWQMAISMSAFGDSLFAMRLPSLLLSTASVGLIFLIGLALGDARAGLVAATLQAVNPFLTRLVHGQVFSDHVDVALLFWTEAAVLLVLVAARSGRASHAALAGVAQGIAWLTKSHPALFVTGLAFALWLAGQFNVDRRSLGFASPPQADMQMRGSGLRPTFTICERQLIAFAIAAIATALPWTLWCATQFPHEFAIEQGGILRHLYANVEQFAAPWDRLLFDYTLRGLLEFWPLAVVSLGILSIDAIRTRNVARAFIVAWALIVLIPHMLATSKTPSATLIGCPAAWLAIGFIVADATRGRRKGIAAVVVAAVLIVLWPQRPRESVMGYGLDYQFAKIMFAAWPLLLQAGFIAVAVVFSGIGIPACLRRSVSAVESLRAEYGSTQAGMPVPLQCFGIALVVFTLLFHHVGLAYRTAADVDPSPVAFAKLGEQVRKQSPPEAAFLVDDETRNEHLIAMWWLDRACYPLRPDAFDADVRAILAKGGTPFVLSRRPQVGTPLMSVAGEGTIYRLDR